MAFIWQFSILALTSRTVLRGVVLNEKPPQIEHHLNVLDNLTTLFRSYTKKLLKNSELTIQLDKKEFVVLTDSFGAFELELDHTIEKEPEIDIYFQNKKLKIDQKYPLFFKNSNSKIDVISDIDDTILVSHTASTIKRIGLLSFVTPKRRKAIVFTQKLLHFINTNPATIYYVSKSESNLYRVLYGFIKINTLPKGLLILTPYLNFKQLLNKKKGKDFKLDHILYILKNSLEKRFILFGDDTQKDMEVYAKIAQIYPEKIMRIYIRQTKQTIDKKKQLLLNNLKKEFPSTVYFNDHSNIDIELDHLKTILSVNKDSNQKTTLK